MSAYPNFRVLRCFSSGDGAVGLWRPGILAGEKRSRPRFMPMKTLFPLALLCLAVAVHAQSPGLADIDRVDQARSLDDSAISLPTPENPGAPSRSLALGRDEALRVFSVTLKNDEEQELKIYGVQTTSGLFVVDFSRTVPAGGQASVSLVYLAKPGVDSTGDSVRLLTDRGEKTIELKHDRPVVARLETKSLQWQVGEKPATKSVFVTVVPRTSVPKGARAMGKGNMANVEPVGENRYRVDVTPASTDSLQEFPVLLQLAACRTSQ